MLEEVCPYTACYRHMRQVVDGYERDGVHVPEVSLGFASMDGADVRRYNHPQVFEPAVIFVGADGAPPSHRDIVIWPHEYETHRIPEYCEHVDPLAYTLLFPNGDPGWNPTLRHREGFRTAKYQRVTPIQFYSFRLMVRSLELALPHAGGILFQQYVCDAYARAEGQRLNWVRQNQDNLRAEYYKGLFDAVHHIDYVAGKTQIGKQVILPSTYAGSPRAMQQQYLDAMAMVKRFGKPDYFITMTGNLAWPAGTSRQG